MSVAEELTKSKRKKKSSMAQNDSKENFFDVFEGSDSDDDTLVTAGLSSPLGALSPWGSSPDLTRRTPVGSPAGTSQRDCSHLSLPPKAPSELPILIARSDDDTSVTAGLTLSGPNPPNINCVDAQGNSCLHCAAYRGHTRLAVLLLQNGVDTTLRNNCGQLAIEISKDNDVREVLNVRPVQRLQRTAARFEGPLLKRSRFLGWRPVWAVLQRGVLLYYGSRAEGAREGGRCRSRSYLDGAKLTAPDTEPALIVISLSDGDTHRLAVQGENITAARQSWITAFNEHIAYSGHYLWAGASPDAAREATEDLEDECKPLGSMQDALTAATNSLALLETQLRECSAILTALDKSVSVGNSLHHSAYMRFQHACGSGAEALAALRHCAALVAQARDADAARLNREIERNRVLEEALAALARTHHALEMSVAEELTKSKRKKKSSMAQNDSKENFFDVFEGSDSDDDTLVTAGLSSPLGALSPWGSSPDLTRHTPVGSPAGDVTPTNEARGFPRRASVSSGSPQSLHTAVSPASSRGTLVSQGGHVYRNARPYSKAAKLSSQWSL
ncbi:oxysterol-binding protein-related protein 1-like [Ostrinia furnacalis]|uniref:oxysterol-binding protein-related protein 1-like n=1 Tax=Ostrinia furnacalis TaxID=93504 RepID=UPI00103D1F62|nr:oxysterol-binding protein-related protein 1-like [Ostrinia furnacalis]